MIKTNRKKSILDSAEELFAQKGYFATSIADIIEKAGIARGTFYIYFENKKAIFDTLLDNLLDLVMDSIKRIDPNSSEQSPMEQLKENLFRTFSILIEKKNLTKILLSYSSGVDCDFDQKVADFYQKVFTLIESAISLGMEMEILRISHPKIIASCIMGLFKEVTFALISKHYAIDDIEVLIDEILEFSLNGLLIKND